MSIIARLLHKTEKQQQGGAVLPGLHQAVTAKIQSSEQRRRRYLLIATGAIAAIAGGSLLVVYLQTRTVAPLIRPVSNTLTTAMLPERPVVQSASSSSHKNVSTLQEVRIAEDSTSDSKTIPVRQKKPKLPFLKDAAKDPVRTSGSQKAAAGQTGEPQVRDRATVDALLFAAHSAEARRDYNQALLTYRRVLDADPANYRVMTNLAGVNLALGRHAEALTYTELALRRNGNHVPALINAGIAHGRMGATAKAKVMLEQAVVTEPANRLALFNLALLLERGDDAGRSIVVWRQLADTGDPRGLLGIARIRERQKEIQLAMQLYREVLAHADAGQQLKDTARERLAILDR